MPDSEVSVTQADVNAAADFIEGWEPGPETTVDKLAVLLANIRADERAKAFEEAAGVRTERDEALAKLAACREALEPFAEVCAHLHPSHPDDGETLDGFSVGDLRRARAALATEERNDAASVKPVGGA